MNWIELSLRQWALSKSKLYRNIVKPARREAAIEVPQSRNDHSDDRDLNIGASLIEGEEIEALSLGEVQASHHLLPLVKSAELRVQVRSNQRIAVRT